MSSEPIRDPKGDRLLTPQNAAFVIIDYQPVQVNSIASMDRQSLVNNIVGASRAAIVYGLPIVHSTVNVKTGLNKPPISQLRKVLAKYNDIELLLQLGEYKRGSDPDADFAIDKIGPIRKLLQQGSAELVPFAQSSDTLKKLFA